MSEDIKKQLVAEGDNQSSVEKATGAKQQKGKRTIAVILVIALSLGTAVGGFFAHKAYKEHKEYTAAKNNAQSIVSLYQDHYTCSLDEPIYSSMNYDTKICDGSILVEVLNENGIKYCEILDEYYTSDGRNIALVTVEVTRDEYIDPTIINDEVKGSSASYFTLPEGYELKGDKGYRQVTETFTVISEVRKDGDYKKISIPGVQGTITNVINVEVIGTKPYDVIASSDFVCDVDDNFAAKKNGDLSIATHTLKPKQN